MATVEIGGGHFFDNPSIDPVPRLPESTDVDRAHFIVIGHYADVISRNKYPIELDPWITPGTHELDRAVRTTTYAFEVERFVKGGTTAGSTRLNVELLDGFFPVTLDERLLVLLVPWHEDTYSSGIWTMLHEHDGVVLFGNGEAVPEAAGMSLDGYADRLEVMVQGR